MRGSIAIASDWNCIECARERDHAIRVTKRACVLLKSCGVCRMPLADSPPAPPYVGEKYFRNSSHRHPHGRRCQRCLARRAPPWSVALRTACVNWHELRNGDLNSQALYIVIRNLGCTTIYKVPWSRGVDKIAIFLGSQYQARWRRRST